MRMAGVLKRLGKAVKYPTVILTFAAIFLAATIWFLGPSIGYGDIYPIASVSTRLTLLLIVAVAWGVICLCLRARRSRQDEALLAALRRQEAEKENAAARDDAVTETRFRSFCKATGEVVRLVGTEHRGLFSRRRYALPWFFVLGGTQTGKSALAEALASPLPTIEKPAGTPYVSDDAVLVEFPGHLLNQDEKPAHLFSRMLDHLRRLRPLQPVNGILVTVGADELLAHADAIDHLGTMLRGRLDHIANRLDIQVPVYLVVTKLDLVAGFHGYFDALTTEERKGVFGLPVDASAEAESTATSFAGHFEDLVQKLANRLLTRLQEEPAEQQRRQMLVFPAHFNALQTPLRSLISELTKSRPFSRAVMLRGVFFTSAASHVPPRGASAGFEPVASRRKSLFLQNLLNDIVLHETGLTQRGRRAGALMRLREFSANAALTLAAIALLAFWWSTYNEGRAYSMRIEKAAIAARSSIETVSAAGTEADFAPVIVMLNRLRQLFQDAPQSFPLGLLGTRRLQQTAHEVYDVALAKSGFPFLWRYLSDALQDPGTPATVRFQALGLYLTLGKQADSSLEEILPLAGNFAENRLPGAPVGASDDLAAHIARLTTLDLKTPPRDPSLIARARSLTADYTLARLVYDDLLASEEVRQLHAWRPVDHMGSAGPQVLSRVSGDSFWDTIAGVYTRAGHSIVPEAVRAATNRIADDFWALGIESSQIEAEKRRIREGALALYTADYIRQWDAFLADLDIRGSSAAGPMADTMALLLAKPSPIKELLSAVAQETELSPRTGSGSSLLSNANRLGRNFVASVQTRQVQHVANDITRHFQPLHEAVAVTKGQEDPIGTITALLEPLYRQINHIAAGGDVLELGTKPQELQTQLREALESLAPSLQPLFRRIVTKASATVSGYSRQRIGEIWETTVLPLCRNATEGLYPFEPESPQDASLEDFTDLFAPSGAIAQFREEYLKPYIDTTAKPWRWRDEAEPNPELEKNLLHPFELANTITSSYFAGKEKPNLTLSLEPTDLDSRARTFRLSYGETKLVYSHEAPTPTAFTWPGEPATLEATVTMAPEIPGERTLVRKEGPWALFRLFDSTRFVEDEEEGNALYRFDIGSRTALLRLTPASAETVFSGALLEAFACPEFK